MTIRNLPTITVLEAPAGLSFDTDEAAMARWRPEVRAVSGDGAPSIDVYDAIGENSMTGYGVTARGVSDTLRIIGNRDVVVHINSPGGDFFEGVAIYNLLRMHPHAVHVKIMGLAASAASIIAMAGDVVSIADAGFVMIHNSMALLMGNRHDMRAAADMLEPFDAAMANVYAARTGQKVSAIDAWMDSETWFYGSQAIEAGFADDVLDGGEVSATSDAGTKALAALRRIDIALAKQGMSRSERRSLIAEFSTGTPCAADAVTPCADDLSAAVARLRSTIKG